MKQAPPRSAPAWWLALERAFHQQGDRLWKVVEAIIWTLIAVSFVIVGVDLSRGPGTPPLPWMGRVDRVVLVAFIIELVLRVATYRPVELDLFEGSSAWRARKHVTGRLRFLLSPLMLIDLLAVLAIVPALRGLRALRLLRLIRGSDCRL